MAKSVKDIKNICKSAIVDERISILGSKVINSEIMISEGVRKNVN